MDEQLDTVQTEKECLRIVFTAPRFHTNQIQAVQALKDRGCRVDYLVLYRGPTEDYTVLDPIVLGDGLCFRVLRNCLVALGRVRPEQERDLRITWGSPPVVRFWRELRRLRPSAVVVRLSPLPFAGLAIMFACLQRARLVLYEQQPLHGPCRFRRRLFAHLLHLLCRARWITPVEGDPLRYPPWSRYALYVPFVARPAVLPPGRAAERAALQVSPVRILCVGKFEPRKNLDLMVEAFKSVLPGRSLRLTIVGECSSPAHERVLETVRRIIRDEGLEHLIEIMVNVPYKDLQKMYFCHDVFVLPSSREPASVSILEAMTYGLPVICSDSNGTRSYIVQGVNGYVFKSDNVGELARCLVQMLDTPGAIAKMGEQSLLLVRERHSPEQYYQNLLIALGKEELGGSA